MRLRFLTVVFLGLGLSLGISSGNHSLAFGNLRYFNQPSLGSHVLPVSIPPENFQQSPSDPDIQLRQQISRLFMALNHRDLETIKTQISPTRIYVEIANKAGAYLSNSQTLAVMESFLRSHSSLSAKFEFDNAEGTSGSASGTLTAQRDGHTLTYKLNFGFTRNDAGIWLLTRISMR